MTDERWKECRHHHHGCACREHMWEEKVKKLAAEPTAKQEREDIISWLRFEAGQYTDDRQSLILRLVSRIEIGMHRYEKQEG